VKRVFSRREEKELAMRVRSEVGRPEAERRKRGGGRLRALVLLIVVTSLVGSVAEAFVAATPASAGPSYGPPTHLVVTGQPTPNLVTAGQDFTLAISVEDAQGNVVADNTDSIELSFYNYAPGVNLDCGAGNTVAAVQGVATFNCSIDTSGDYFLAGSDETEVGPGTSNASNPVGVDPGPAASLKFSVEPQNAASNVAVPVEIQALDSYGNVASNDNSDQISLSLGGGTTGANLACTPSTTGTPSNSASLAFGVIDFTCSVDAAGTGYTLTASNPGGSLPSVTSTAFDVGQESAVLSANPNPDPSFNGTGNFGLSVALLDANGQPLPDDSVEVDAELGNYTASANGSGIAGFTLPCSPDETPYLLQVTDSSTQTFLGTVSEDCINIQFPQSDPIGQSDSPAITGGAPNAPVTVGFGATPSSTPVEATLSGSCTTDGTGTLNYGSCNFVVPSVPGVTAPADVTATVTIGSTSYQMPDYLPMRPASDRRAAGRRCATYALRS
jgi:hypothetical protein